MFESAELGQRVTNREFKERELELRTRLLTLQYRALELARFPILIDFAGVDGAGKGTTVNMLNMWMDPRWIRTIGYVEPSEEARARPRFWRYWRDLPPKGRIGLFLSGRYSPENLMNNFIKIEFLQTDASINPGNSGGPMFNMQGEVIGIASRIFTNSGGFEGIGFAMSSNVANKLLMQETTIWSGMQSMVVSGSLAAALNVPQESGIMVLTLSSKGAASQLGLQGGFLPATINGHQKNIL